MKGVDNRLILVALSVLLLPLLLNAILLFLVSMMAPSMAGFGILSLAKIGGYTIVPLIYLVAFALAIFRYKLSCDGRTIVVIIVAGMLLLPSMLATLKTFLVSDLAPIYPGWLEEDLPDVNAEYSRLFLNNMIVGGYYLGFCTSLFLTTYSKDRKLKALIFVFGGIALGFVISAIDYTYIYSVLA